MFVAMDLRVTRRPRLATARARPPASRRATCLGLGDHLLGQVRGHLLVARNSIV